MHDPVAVLLIAHGSRRPEANDDAHSVAREIERADQYPIVRVAFLELAEPGIDSAGAECVAAGASRVVLLPYFLSPGRHVVDDLSAARERLQARYPGVHFSLARPLGGHPLLVEILRQRAAEAQQV